METSRARSGGDSRSESVRAVAMAGPEPFTIELQRCDDVVVVQPRGDLDIATAERLRPALDGIEHASRIVLDLRGLSFMDSTGLHLLVALHQRSQREGFQLVLLPPAPPHDHAIRLCGLDGTLPFVAAVDEANGDPAAWASGPRVHQAS